eukprot:2591539-Prymnesium_polylepis.1
MLSAPITPRPLRVGSDPPVADFADSVLVRSVELDDGCRRQQLGEGWFDTLANVPTHAITLTIPAIMRSLGGAPSGLG